MAAKKEIGGAEYFLSFSNSFRLKCTISVVLATYLSVSFTLSVIEFDEGEKITVFSSDSVHNVRNMFKFAHEET